ncbi:hypothetical protein G9A89_005189 [Geosiphon pyriformis]|nr:hypothetical protein G9A89_005189 [Geosiphon pyriformis]
MCLCAKYYSLIEFLRAKEANIRSAIDKRMESFETNKGHTIRSVLEHSFHKMVLNHLVVNNELVLEPDLVKSKVDTIMESWTRKHQTVPNVSTFSGVMCSIGFDKFFGVVSNLPNGKTAGLSEAWVSMIPKPYEWESILTNTYSIALIETARKIFFKILSDRIFSACSTFDVLHELWLVLQDMQKAYNLVDWKHLEKSLVRIKMFITDFGLTDDYHVHDRLDQGEVFSPLLWHIFYGPLLCEVKYQESVCEYKINSHFISKSGHAESWTGFFSFLAADAFVDNTIWVGSSQNATQHIFDVAVSDKQFLYLVLVVLYPIVGYKTQFSFVPISVCNNLSVYTDSSLKNLGTIGCRAGAAAFFENINLGLSVSVHSLVLSTLAEL